MKILSIETSCDDAGVAIFDGKTPLVNLVARQTVHTKTGGVVPEVASREHIRTLTPLIKEALQSSRLNLEDIDYFAVTAGPGLMGSLLVGVETARTLAYITGKPLYGLNHLEGHVYANWINPNVIARSDGDAAISRSPRFARDDKYNDRDDKWREPELPALVVIVSGGHSQIVYMKDHGDYKIVGETLDDAAGEAFDKVAKLIGLGYPGGPAISKAAERGDDEAFHLPVAMARSGNLDMSFSGLKTAALYEWQKQEVRSKKQVYINNFAASFEKAVVNSILIKVEDALNRYSSLGVRSHKNSSRVRSNSKVRIKSLILSGGVAANKRLRRETEQLAHEKNVQFCAPPSELCTDNAAMMAMAAYYRIKSGIKPKNFKVSSSLALH